MIREHACLISYPSHTISFECFDIPGSLPLWIHPKPVQSHQTRSQSGQTQNSISQSARHGCNLFQIADSNCPWNIGCRGTCNLVALVTANRMEPSIFDVISSSLERHRLGRFIKPLSRWIKMWTALKRLCSSLGSNKAQIFTFLEIAYLLL